MFISDFAVRNRTSVFVLVAVIIIAGLSSYGSLPRENEPDVKIPYVFVSSTYEGVAPKDIETTITIPIEEKLKGLKNVKEIKSSSSEGVSSIAVEFVTGTDIEDAKRWVKDKVDSAKRELPSDMKDDPTVFEVNLSEMPILTMAVTGPMGLRELKTIAEEIQEEIEGIPGVLECEMSGGLEREIHIEVDPEKLITYGLPFSVLYSAVTGEHTNVSGGSISMGDGRYQIRVPGEFKSVEDFNNFVVATVAGSPVYLRDIARVRDSFRDVTSVSRFNYRDSVNLMVKKRVGENIITIVDGVKKMLEEQKSNLPAGLKITILMDRSREIRLMIGDLENNIITGILLVVIVLMFVLGLRNAVLVGIAIPLSMLLSFSILQFLGITLNMVTLFSLTLALGMLVDNAIVIVENVYRFNSQGIPRERAAMRGTGEVAIPVIASTVTTVAAFYPLLYWTGIMGEFMKFLPITLIITLCASLFVAMIINPAFCAVFVRAPRVSDTRSEEEIEAEGERPVSNPGPILRLYERVLRSALRSRLPVMISACLLLVLMFCFWLLRTGIVRPVEFFPSVEPGACFVNIDPPEGMDIAALVDIGDEIERRLHSFDNVPERFRTDAGRPPEVSARQRKMFDKFREAEGITAEEPVSDLTNIRFVYSKLTTMTGGASSFGQNSSPNHIGIQFHDFEGRVEPSFATIERIRARLTGIPGAHITIGEQQHGPPTGAPINIEVTGDDFEVLGMIASKVRDKVRQIPHTHDVEDDFVKGSPTIELRVDRNKAALLGLSTGMIGQTIKRAINGWNISTYREGNDDFDIYVRVSDSARHDLDILRTLYLPSEVAGAVPLADVVQIHYTGGMGMIRRIDHRRVVTVKGEVNAAKLPGAVAKSIAEKLLANAELPSGYTLRFTGQDQNQKESEEFLSWAFMTALILVFMVLVIQFDSVLDTMIIMVSVVLSFGGIFIGLGFADLPFGIIMTGIGVISLAGVVVNNAIVLLDYIRQLMSRGFDLTDAVVYAAQTRFRPVLLTAVTTILGLIPMITGISYDFKKFEVITASFSSQFWYSMATAVAFGLALATMLTLLVVPVMFHLVEGGRRRVIRWFGGRGTEGSHVTESAEAVAREAQTTVGKNI